MDRGSYRPAQDGGELVKGTIARLALAPAFALGSFVAACGTGAGGPSAPPAIPEVSVKAVDFSYDAPDRIASGLVRISFTNAGAQLHQLGVVRLKAGKTFDDVKTVTSIPAILQAAEPWGGVGSIPGGASRRIVLDMTPGTYVLLSLSAFGADRVPDSAKGMVKRLEVTANTDPVKAGEPAADASVTLDDGAQIPVPASAAPGAHTWKLANKGTLPHVLSLGRALPGKTQSDFDAWLKAQGSVPPPFDPARSFAMGPMSPGQTAWLIVDLEAGDYVAVDNFPTARPAQSAPLTVR